MTEFTTHFNDKEIVFAREGIRYNNEAFIKYDDMEDVLVNEGDLVFRYKGHLIKMPFNPEDASTISTYFKQPEPEAPTQPEDPMDDEFRLDMDRFSYLDQAQQQQQQAVQEQPVEEAPKKKSKKGLIIAGLLVVVVVAVALIILL